MRERIGLRESLRAEGEAPDRRKQQSQEQSAVQLHPSKARVVLADDPEA
jgi:hypothetical protein